MSLNLNVNITELKLSFTNLFHQLKNTSVFADSILLKEDARERCQLVKDINSGFIKT